jgi:hypothetical protein
MFGYDLSASLDELRRTYDSMKPARGTVPAALDDRLRKVVVQFC